MISSLSDFSLVIGCQNGERECCRCSSKHGIVERRLHSEAQRHRNPENRKKHAGPNCRLAQPETCDQGNGKDRLPGGGQHGGRGPNGGGHVPVQPVGIDAEVLPVTPTHMRRPVRPPGAKPVAYRGQERSRETQSQGPLRPSCCSGARQFPSTTGRPGGATMKARILAGIPGCAFSDVEWSVPVGW